MAANVSVALSCEGFGEGPHWDPKTQSLLWVDLMANTLHVFYPQTGKDEKYVLAEKVTCAVPREKGGSAVIALGRNIAFLDYKTGQVEIQATVDEDKPGNHLNDGKCDPNGNFWTGTKGPEPVPTEVVQEQGSLFRFNCKDLKVQHQFDKVNISNGLCWSNDKKTFYYIDSLLRKVDMFDYDINTSNISNRRTAFEIDHAHGYPDGMCIDSDGKLWIAMFDGGKVIQVDPSTGTVLQAVEIPVKQTSSCCWGGPNLDILYITTGSWLLSEEEKKKQPLAGSVFQVKGLNAKGVTPQNFHG